ncbi:MAG: potassium channel family protein [Desulfosudis oleivorans]|nr:potassium channel family protein [Desulfosudis oleivorans]
MDFSQSYLKSGLSIAVAAEGVEYRWFRVFESIFSKHTLKAIGFLVLLSLIAGIIVWSFERRKNSEMFGDGTVEGIGHGIWWAMVTMTTVGYGDKAPKTIGGRIICADLDDFFNHFYRQLYSQHHDIADHYGVKRQGSRF